MSARRELTGFAAGVLALLVAGALLLPTVAAAAPTITPLPGLNLLTLPSGQWLRQDPGNPTPDWYFGLQASDPAGVCSMLAIANGTSAGGSTVTVYGPGGEDFGSGPDCSQQDLYWVHAGTDGAGQDYAEPMLDVAQVVPTAGQFTLALFANGNEPGTCCATQQTQAGVTLNVDNVPVSVSFATPNDSNATVWVDHPVDVTATAHTGPSGVGALACAVDGGKSGAYPAAGLTVDGDGTHTVSCTATNNAIDPAGKVATGGGSLSVRIDEVPPTINFAPQDPASPAAVVVNTADGESGVAGGSVAIAPQGSQSWTQLPTSFDGQHLLATIDDAGLRGAYTIKATSCDAAGNCANTSETVTLPLRLSAVSDVSLAQIHTPAKIVRERVRVGYHYELEERHGRRIRVEVGGRYRLIRIVIPVDTSCGHRRVELTSHLWREITVCRPLAVKLETKRRVGFGRDVIVRGLLMTAQGAPIGDAPVAIETAPSSATGRFSTAAVTTTSSTGEWSAALPPGPSRIIRAVYGGSTTTLPATGQASVIVPARVTIRINPRIVRWGQTIVIRGRVLGGYVPRSSKLLRLDIGVDGVDAIQGIPNIDPNGDFRTTYTFRRFTGRVRFWFTVSTLPESAFPWAPTRSRRVYVTVS